MRNDGDEYILQTHQAKGCMLAPELMAVASTSSERATTGSARLQDAFCDKRAIKAGRKRKENLWGKRGPGGEFVRKVNRGHLKQNPAYTRMACKGPWRLEKQPWMRCGNACDEVRYELDALIHRTKPPALLQIPNVGYHVLRPDIVMKLCLIASVPQRNGRR